MTWFKCFHFGLKGNLGFFFFFFFFFYQISYLFLVSPVLFLSTVFIGLVWPSSAKNVSSVACFYITSSSPALPSCWSSMCLSSCSNTVTTFRAASTRLEVGYPGEHRPVALLHCDTVKITWEDVLGVRSTDRPLDRPSAAPGGFLVAWSVNWPPLACFFLFFFYFNTRIHSCRSVTWHRHRRQQQI